MHVVSLRSYGYRAVLNIVVRYVKGSCRFGHKVRFRALYVSLPCCLRCFAGTFRPHDQPEG